MLTSTTIEYYSDVHYTPDPASKLKDTGCTFVGNEVNKHHIEVWVNYSHIRWMQHTCMGRHRLSDR